MISYMILSSNSHNLPLRRALLTNSSVVSLTSLPVGHQIHPMNSEVDAGV